MGHMSSKASQQINHGVVQGPKVRRLAEYSILRAPQRVKNTSQSAQKFLKHSFTRTKALKHSLTPRRLTLRWKGYLLKPRTRYEAPIAFAPEHRKIHYLYEPGISQMWPGPYFEHNIMKNMIGIRPF